MNQNLRKTAVWLPLVVAIALIAGMWLGKYLFSDRYDSPSRAKIDAILGLVDENYVDNVNIDSLLEVSIPDLLSHLDPHSTYIPASDLQQVNEDLGGSFSGVGIQFNMLGDTINVLEVIPGGPSDKVGIMAGDRIVAIDDSIAAGRQWPQSRVLKSLRGDRGSVVKVDVKRPGVKGLLTFEITRGDIPVNTVDAAYMINDTTGYIHINKFGANTFGEFITAAINLRAGGARAFMIDLRGNGGGYMEPAVLIANEFLGAGQPIVSMRGRKDSNNAATVADGTGALRDCEVVVLIDELTASASEILSGAIQDNDRGLVVGRRSFGKGLVQHQHELPDSSAVRLTVARYYTPSGRCIQKTYAPGVDYENDLNERYSHGEFYSADSIHLDRSLIFTTLHGREVYGGGGIMPDLFVPNDTSGITSWYLDVVNRGLFHKFTFTFTDANRARLSQARTPDELLEIIPSDGVLLSEFVQYTMREGVPVRMGYINQSRDLIVDNLKALITRNMLGTEAYYQVFNDTDPTVGEALDALGRGEAAFPLLPDESPE
ncbi:MAG: S41 family peptidase [Duncaniella sp.]|nr:S41 family peptidase [Duncaniella sp.]